MCSDKVEKLLSDVLEQYIPFTVFKNKESIVKDLALKEPF